MSANLVASVNLLVGLLSFAIITGLLFARFSQPAVRIRFSKVGLIAPFKNGYAFMFRIVNERNSQLVDLRATVAFTRVVTDASGIMTRRFFSLNLDRDRVMFFPLHWTVVHPITAESPLADLSEEDFRSSKGEFVVALQGTDEATGQAVHARSSFGASEVIFYAKFSDLLGRDQDGYLSVDIGKLDQFQPLTGID
jgi:inward rectifier potassium channel